MDVPSITLIYLLSFLSNLSCFRLLHVTYLKS